MLPEMTWLKNQVRKSPYSQEVSRANHTALQENVWRLVTSVTCGENLHGSFAKLSRNGLWLKTYQGYCQVSMEGFSDEFSETWPRWGMMLDGECFRHFMPAWNTSAREYALLPTPVASDGMCWRIIGGENGIDTIAKILKRHNPHMRMNYITRLCGYSVTQTAEYYETLMGFPTGWTELPH